MPQCQFLFSAVFGSRKAVRAIFSEFDETKAKPPIFPRDTRSQKGKPGGGPRPPNHMLARLGPQARREVRREPRTSTDIAPSLIYCLRRENPKKQVIFQKGFRSAAAIDDKFRGTEVSVPARCQDGEVPLEPSPSTPSPSSSPLLTPMMRRE